MERVWPMHSLLIAKKRSMQAVLSGSPLSMGHEQPGNLHEAMWRTTSQSGRLTAARSPFYQTGIRGVRHNFTSSRAMEVRRARSCQRRTRSRSKILPGRPEADRLLSPAQTNRLQRMSGARKNAMTRMYMANAGHMRAAPVLYSDRRGEYACERRPAHCQLCLVTRRDGTGVRGAAESLARGLGARDGDRARRHCGWGSTAGVSFSRRHLFPGMVLRW